MVTKKDLDDGLFDIDVDGAGDIVEESTFKLDNEYAQLVQDLLEKRS
mgnify:CR=1 FL=1|jgi:hypothetical protein